MLISTLALIFLSWSLSKLPARELRLLLSGILCFVFVLGSCVWLNTLSWKGMGANPSRLLLLQVLVTGFAILARSLKTNFQSSVYALIVVAFCTPIIWHTIYSNDILIHMVHDAPRHGQVVWLLCSQILFLLATAYCRRFSWEEKPKGKALEVGVQNQV